MNDDRSVERAARSWIETGPTQAPDRAVERALLTIETTPQERDVRIPRRFTTMPIQARVAAAAVIGVLVVGGALMYLGRGDRSDVGGPSPSAAPPSSPNPAASAPNPAASLSLSSGYKDVKGWIVFEHFGQAPDGSTTEFNPDNRMVWLVKADGTGLHELAPGKPGDGKVSPDISPDGRTVVFSSWGPRGRVWSVPIEGGDPVMLTTDCSGAENECFERDPAFSPDGKRIAFAQDLFGAEPSSVIGIRDRAAGTVTFIESTRVPRTASHLHQPSWSPDGTRIAYHLDTQAPADEQPTKIRIEIVNVDGTSLQELPAPAGEAKAGDPDWSPDGSLIVFSTMPNREGEGDGNGGPGIFTIHPDGTGLTDVCGSCLQGGVAPSWTPDGEHILFWGFRTWAMMDPDGSNMAHINQPELVWFGEDLGYGYAAWLQPTP
jgi:Tol biopolymer transport system component